MMKVMRRNDLKWITGKWERGFYWRGKGKEWSDTVPVIYTVVSLLSLSDRLLRRRGERD